MCSRGAVVALIPAHNEGFAIGAVVRDVRGWVDRVLVVDDGSSDATAAQAKAAGAAVLRRPVRGGKGAAVRTGLEALRRSMLSSPHSAVVLLDGDGQHTGADVAALLGAWRAGAQFVVGDRSAAWRNAPLVRRATNYVMARLLRPLIDNDLRDTQCGARLIDASVSALLIPRVDHFELESDMLLAAHRAGVATTSADVGCRYDGEQSKIRCAVDTIRFVRWYARAWIERVRAARWKADSDARRVGCPLTPPEAPAGDILHV